MSNPIPQESTQSYSANQSTNGNGKSILVGRDYHVQQQFDFKFIVSLISILAIGASVFFSLNLGKEFSPDAIFQPKTTRISD